MKNKKNEDMPVGRLKRVGDFLPPPSELVQSEKNVNVTTEIIRDTNAFIAMRDEWNAVLAKSGINNPFLSHEWLSAWWKGYGHDKELFIVSFKDGERFIGFVPLMKYGTKLTGISIQAVGFLSNHWTRMDFILCDKRQECLSLLCDLIKESREAFLLAQMDTLGENFSQFIELLKKNCVAFHETPKPHAFIPLSGSWEDYFNSQSKNFRMDARRKLKRLSQEGEVTLRRSAPGDANIIDKLKTVATNSWQANDHVNIISSVEGEQFYTEAVRELSAKGCLDISILYAGERPAAYMVGLKYHETYFAFDTAYDKTFHPYSPGLILHNLLIEQLYKDGIRRLDLGYTASYKKRWSEEITLMTDIIIYPGNFKGRILSFIKQLKRKMNKYNRSGHEE
ncbi:MAG TPA: hypothetical protein DD723_01795 [Candidatus Omnitrophica bacterium]|nr:MAG: hypothetical protein A2Z81_08835 [Omnitrophica WOR_2 bacterium GWA2_45_18]OGX19768.1 MAG: hypothetical protein A2Y04_05945 [Omnitrophica WOR_2 bacterium GWC2_45_7]HBR14259.1 hypothetical protein [Candidatus Omnitrophota bacterium]